ncbi:SMP-30/gluconolactonase/LRE family protein [Pseudactinotalea terrae]|uniref:SMP-30/gluconolactonase/LRE family protein n=1 Tax=Pseudactinotalea terrae TaxID=1743262 RepID=UPI0019D583E9|nr:SMP-30/gluconolactonase/LRE family protein [Pseudactinotalea terrae]
MEPTSTPVLASTPLELDPAPGHEPEFTALFPEGATLDLLATGGTWFEGPAWTGENEIVWSDVVGNRLLVWTPEQGAGILLEPSHHQNGHTIDREGRLVAASHGERAVVRREHDGAWHVLADRHEGRRFNSPNDLVVDSRGAIWFTDPRYGIDKPEEGYGGTVEMDGARLYRLDPDGSVTAMTPPHPGPNGLAFSPDESVLYLADSEVGHILAFEVLDGGTSLRAPVTFAVLDPGPPDGVRVDPEGRVWSSCASGVQVFAPPAASDRPAERLGTVRIPERTANLAFGGPGGTTLAVTATSGLYRLQTS